MRLVIAHGTLLWRRILIEIAARLLTALCVAYKRPSKTSTAVPTFRLTSSNCTALSQSIRPDNFKTLLPPSTHHESLNHWRSRSRRFRRPRSLPSEKAHRHCLPPEPLSPPAGPPLSPSPPHHPRRTDLSPRPRRGTSRPRLRHPSLRLRRALTSERKRGRRPHCHQRCERSASSAREEDKIVGYERAGDGGYTGGRGRGGLSDPSGALSGL